MTATYPSEETLQRIKDWPSPDWKGLLELACHEFAGYGKVTIDTLAGEWTLITGGWSGNEEIISAMQSNHLFWAACWQSSVRGGLFTFKVL